MTSPSGQQIRIGAGPYEAVTTEVGGGLRSLTYDGRLLLMSYGENEIRPAYAGAVLAPWCGRVVNGRYAVGERRFELPLNEPARGQALHGLAAWSRWQLTDRTAASAKWSVDLVPQPWYPWPLTITAGYRLDEVTGLTWTVSAHNDGDEAAPVGLGVHPYAVAPAGEVDDWTLTFDAARIQLATADRLVPTGIADLPDAASFRRGRRLAGVSFDGAVTGLSRPADGVRRASLVDDNGDGVEFRWDAAGKWLQLFTCDDLPGELRRRAVAIEPQTCPPDAFNNGIDLAWLAPGSDLELSVGIGALSGSVLH
ncbi:aldose 1-epimerase family protein [Nostocoides australiense]